MNRTLTALAFAAAIAVPLADAAASPGTTTAPVNLRAGPSTAYPVVTVLPPSAPLEVYGCTEGWAWCDVAWGDARGWISASYLSFQQYRGPSAPLYRYGPTIGLGVIQFNFGSYWNNHYRARPWYATRDRWGPPPRAHRPAPPPRPHAQRPPPRPPHQAGPGGRPPSHGGRPDNHHGGPPQHGRPDRR